MGRVNLGWQDGESLIRARVERRKLRYSWKSGKFMSLFKCGCLPLGPKANVKHGPPTFPVWSPLEMCVVKEFLCGNMRTVKKRCLLQKFGFVQTMSSTRDGFEYPRSRPYNLITFAGSRDRVRRRHWTLPKTMRRPTWGLTRPPGQLFQCCSPMACLNRSGCQTDGM